jgi:hypothetical protein
MSICSRSGVQSHGHTEAAGTKGDPQVTRSDPVPELGYFATGESVLWSESDCR